MATVGIDDGRLETRPRPVRGLTAGVGSVRVMGFDVFGQLASLDRPDAFHRRAVDVRVGDQY